jgi:TolB-like protein/tetratricopeptide (TPR) repeat protein
LKLFQELQRRNVFRVGIAYAVAAWVLLQVADLVLENIEAPAWVIQAMMLVVALGFIAALIIAWAYELTPEGIKRERDVDRGQSIMRNTGRKLDRIIMGFLLVAVAYFAVDKFVLDLSRDSKLVPAEPPIIIDMATPVAGFSGRAAIAVIPFINMSNDPEQEYFADGLTEDLITGLQSFQSFPIIARTSTFKYKGTSPDVREIATALGAGYIVEGSVRKVDDDVRINVQLNDRHGQHVWAENYDFEFKDVLHIQSELVSKVMLAIEPELIISEADRTRFVRTEDMEAFDYFLRAATNTFASFAFTNLNGEVVTPERLELAREYATKAVELDPNFAAAWRMLNHIEGSYAVNYAYLFSEQELKEIIERGIEYGQRSRLLSPFEPTVCSCLAAMLLMSGDVQGARLLQEESLRQNPSSAIVHAVMAKILQVSGDDERALEEIRLAKRLSPEDMAMTTFLYFEAAIYQDLGRFSEAVTAANMSLLLSPLNNDAQFVKITSLYASGQRELARAALVQLKASSPPDFQPVSGWEQPFVESVADNVTLANGISLHGLRYNEGLRLVFEDLGWDTEQ